MKQNRIRKPINMSLDPKQIERLRVYSKAQEGSPSVSRLIDIAIQEFLEKRDG